jgi:hypothetical protein
MLTLILSLIGLYFVYENVYFKKGSSFVSIKDIIDSGIQKAKSWFK